MLGIGTSFYYIPQKNRIVEIITTTKLFGGGLYSWGYIKRLFDGKKKQKIFSIPKEWIRLC